MPQEFLAIVRANIERLRVKQRRDITEIGQALEKTDDKKAAYILAYKILKGERSLRADELYTLATFFDVPLQELTTDNNKIPDKLNSSDHEHNSDPLDDIRMALTQMGFPYSFIEAHTDYLNALHKSQKEN